MPTFSIWILPSLYVFIRRRVKLKVQIAEVKRCLPAPANKWGPGNNFPVLNHVLSPPPTDSNTPNPNNIDPALKCLSL